MIQKPKNRKMKYICRYIWFLNIFEFISSFNITLNYLSRDYNKGYNKVTAPLPHQDLVTHQVIDELNRLHMNAKLRRHNRDFMNTIDKIPTKLRNEMAQHQKHIRQNQMCHQTPCQKIPFIVSYQVKETGSKWTVRKDESGQP